MYCTRCGNNLKEDAKFCVACGSPVSGASKNQPIAVLETAETVDDTPKGCRVCGRRALVKKAVQNGKVCSKCAELCPNYRAETVEAIKGFYDENARRASIFRESVKMTRFALRGHDNTISIDNDNMLVTFRYNNEINNPQYFCFSEISGYEIAREGQKTITKSKGGVGRAVVGGALFGGVGAIVGASTGKTSSTTTVGFNVLKIAIDAHSGKIIKLMPSYPKGLPPFLDKILEETAEQVSAVPQTADYTEEIRRLSELLHAGHITQEEFNAKKRQLLNL